MKFSGEFDESALIVNAYQGALYRFTEHSGLRTFLEERKYAKDDEFSLQNLNPFMERFCALINCNCQLPLREC